MAADPRLPERHFAVDLGQAPVGLITERGNLTSFSFLDSYLEQRRRPVLGQTFEEEPRGRWRQAQRLPVWFSNLLPEEGPFRDYLANALDVSSRSEIRILEALGGDLPGAVTVRAAGGAEVEALRRFDHDGRPVAPPPATPGGIRFSVAGVQLKLSMVQDANTIRLAGRGEWGNRFVKFPGVIPRIPENEFAMMTLAGACGIRVPHIELVAGSSLGPLPAGFDRLRDQNVFVIERFDRSGGRQIHIEDLNQVIGNWPEHKYQGLSYEALGRLLVELCGEEHFWEYLRRLLFNLAVGNEDAHLKNWSLIYPDRVTPQLAPLYDVVSTIVLPGFTRETALKLGGKRRPQTVDLETMLRLVTKAGGSVGTARRVVSALLEGIRAHEPAIRQKEWLTKSEWSTLDSYRATVPLLRDLIR
jgi:serine/threonine-protein kinase HipA